MRHIASFVTALVVATACSLQAMAPAQAVIEDCYKHPDPPNGDGYSRLDHGDPDGCVIQDVQVTLPSSGAVYMHGFVKVDDSASALNTDLRYLLEGTIFCYDQAGSQVFHLGAVRNIWVGIATSGVYPKGVFTGTPGATYRCIMKARQYGVGSDPVAKDWFVAPGDHSLTASSFANGGGSSPGPNMEPWPDPAPFVDLTSGDGTVEVSREEFAVSNDASSVRVVSSTPLTTCAFQSDILNGRMCTAVNKDQPLVVTVWLYARQETSPSDPTPCASALLEQPQTIDEKVHHFTVTLDRWLDLDATCTGPVVVKNEILISAGRGYIGTGEANSTVRHGYNIAVGAGW